MLYFYLLAFAALFSVAYAQTCETVNATFNAPRICFPTYATPTANAQDTTDANGLSAFFSSLTTKPSQTCADSYLAFYCAKFYPECNSDNSVKTPCQTNCINIVTDCDDYTSLFEGSAYPIPSAGDCTPSNGYSTDTSVCSLPPATNITSFYTECTAVNSSLINEESTFLMCTPRYTVPPSELTTSDYTLANQVWLTIQKITIVYGADFVVDTMYPCIKALANYYCTEAFLPCPDNGALPVLQTCASACETIITECAKVNLTYIFADPDVNILLVPTDATCSALPTTNCYTPQNNDTYVGYFFNGDPPVAIPTAAPTKKPHHPSATTVPIPPHGFAVGGGVGAGVLIGLLLLIGLIMLVMKKQDSR